MFNLPLMIFEILKERDPMIPYHKWLLRQRVYCEHGQCLKPATKVVNRNGKDYVYCDFHGYQPKNPRVKIFSLGPEHPKKQQPTIERKPNEQE